MTLFEASRLRIVVVTGFAVAVVVFSLVFSHRIDRVEGAKQAVPAEQLTAAEPRSNTTPVLVELFTSEGCSSCPPADALLARLDHDQPIAGADIMILGEHVDYWDSLGWHDRFSSAEATARQRLYRDSFKLDDIYTPQIVVNGHLQYAGADRNGIYKGINQAAADKVLRLQISNVTEHASKITFDLVAGSTMPEEANIFAALVDPTDDTEVRAGENSGRRLHHAGVVRQMGVVGSLPRLGTFAGHPFGFQANLSGAPQALSGMRLVVFAQTRRGGFVAGAASCVLGPQNYDGGTVKSASAANRCAAGAI